MRIIKNNNMDAKKDIQEEIIGRILLTPNIFINYLDKINTKHFDYEYKLIIEEAISLLINDKIDESNLIAELFKKGALEQIGGKVKIESILKNTKSSKPIDTLLSALKDSYIVSLFKTLISNTTVSNKKQVLSIIEKISDADSDFASTQELSDILQEISTFNESYENTSIFGINKLDSAINMQEPGLIVITGKSGHGKSGLISNIAYKNIKSETPFYIISGENSKKSQLRRILAHHLLVSQSFIKSKSIEQMIDSKEYIEFKQKLDALKNKAYIESKSFSLDEIEKTIIKLSKKGCNIFVIDRLELFLDIKSSDTANSISNIVNRLRAISINNKSKIVLITQMTKDEAKKIGAPSAHSGKGSAEILNASTIFLSTWIPAFEDANIEDIEKYYSNFSIEGYELSKDNDIGQKTFFSLISIEKNTEGESGIRIPLYFNISSAMFETELRHVNNDALNNIIKIKESELSDMPF